MPAGLAAKPVREFHTGPYLQFIAGARDASYDTDRVANIAYGRDIEPSYGFAFGWNLNDPIAIELRGLYSSSGVDNGQEHLMTLHVDSRWHLLLDTLTDFRSLRILPFVGAGPVAQMNVLPGTAGATETRVLQWGVGLSGSAGISALFHHDIVYCTVVGHVDYLRRLTAHQTVGGAQTTVYRGEWNPDWSATASLGVHF